MRTKTYQVIKEKAPAIAVDPLTAVTFLKEHGRNGFDETIEIHIRLGVNASKSDQMVRGSVVLPSGTVKQQKIVVFTDDDAAQKAAQDAGATQAGGEELIDEIVKAGNLDADITVATPKMMPKVAKAAKILGPKGLMPNPKTGTVTDTPEQVVQELLGGKVSFKMDQLGNIHHGLGKVSWDTEKTVSNIEAFITAVKEARPPSAKGELIKSITIKSTMSPGIRVAA